METERKELTMTTKTTTPRLSLAARLRAARAVRTEREALRRDLETFTTHAELLELSAILQRYPDAEGDVIRRELHWTAA
jgi:hypothetical protein